MNIPSGKTKKAAEGEGREQSWPKSPKRLFPLCVSYYFDIPREPYYLGTEMFPLLE